MERIALDELRRYVVAHQRYATRRRRGTSREVLDTVRRLSCVQLDSISTVERSHRIVLSSRVGNYPRTTVSRLLREGKIFEYWAHEACLLPDRGLAALPPPHVQRTSTLVGPVIRREPELAEHVLGEIRERGALGSRHFDGKKSGTGMWNLKPEKRMLDALWSPAGSSSRAGEASSASTTCPSA